MKSKYKYEGWNGVVKTMIKFFNKVNLLKCYKHIEMSIFPIMISANHQQFLNSLSQFVSYHLISEIVIISIIIIILVHKRGKSKNKKIATKYLQVISPLLSKWFKKYDAQLVYESPNIYKLYPSHCDTCLFAIVSFALVPRQQIFSFFFNSLVFKNRDQLVLEIPVNNENPLSLTAAIVRRKQIKSITKKSFPDIKQLCKEYKPANKQTETKLNVPASHCLLVQKSDHVRYFLYSEKQANIWKIHGKSVKLVYISDVNKFSRYPMAVRMVINLNSQDLVPMLEWLMSFIERMSKARMSLAQKKQAQKKRQNLKITYD